MGNKVYLGDGVYAEYDGYGVKLLANDPYEPTDVIYIEDMVLRSLNDYFRRMRGLDKEEADD